jgi:membrane protein DedA with SNARE-associated domain
VTAGLATLAVTDLIRRAGYAGLFLVVLAENLFPPVPSEIVLPFAGWEIAQDRLQLVPAFIAATAGSVAGALILYELARRGGRPAILSTRQLTRIRERDLDRAEAQFRRHGPWLVLVGRCVPGIRSLISIPAGMSAMPIALFIALTALGSAAWNALLIGAGIALGSQFDRVEGVLGPVSTAVVALSALTTVAVLIVIRRRRPANSG